VTTVLRALKDRFLAKRSRIADLVPSMTSGAFDDHVQSLSRRGIVGGSGEKSTLLTITMKENYNAPTFFVK
jgi:hypothetical protein